VSIVSRWYPEGSARECGKGGREFANKARQKKYCGPGPAKIFLIVPVLAVKNFGASVTGPEIFFARTGSTGNFFSRSNPMRSLKLAA